MLTAKFYTPHGTIEVWRPKEELRVTVPCRAYFYGGYAFQVAEVDLWGGFRDLATGNSFAVVWPEPGEKVATLISFTCPFFRIQAPVRLGVVEMIQRRTAKGEKAC